MAEKARLMDISKCIGCRGCQVACKQWNGLPAEKTKFFAAPGGYQNPADLSPTTFYLVKFYERETPKGVKWRFRAHTCMHCTDASCMDACPVEPKAMSRDAATGFVYVDEERCMGCGSCEASCPFGVPHVDENKGKSMKCSGCSDRVAEGREPACAKACPSDAISFGDLETMQAKAQARAEELKKQGFKPYLYGIKERGGLRTLYVMPEGIAFYDLPKKPEARADLELFHHHMRAFKASGRAVTARAVREIWALCGRKGDFSSQRT